MESLNFIDISSHQGKTNDHDEIDLDLVYESNDLHGLIVKSTEGMGYVNPYCDKWVQWAIKKNIPWGFFHYLNSNNPVEEANSFYKHTMNYWGHGMPAADYEGEIVSKYGTYYLRRFLEQCYELTGIKPFVYCNLGVIQADVNGFRQLAEEGYPLWLAQYRYNVTNVGIGEIWQSGSYAPFGRITMHQYAHTGRVKGYNFNLDLDIFYGSREDWEAMAKNQKPEEPPDDGPLAIAAEKIGIAQSALAEAMAILDDIKKQGGL